MDKHNNRNLSFYRKLIIDRFVFIDSEPNQMIPSKNFLLTQFIACLINSAQQNTSWNQNCLFINLSETTTFFNFYFWRELILANIVPVSYIRRQSLCSPKPILWRYNTNFFHHSFLFTKICTLCTIFRIFCIIVCFYNFFISISMRHNVDIYSPKTYSTSRRIQAGSSWYTSDIINQGRKSS